MILLLKEKLGTPHWTSSAMPVIVKAYRFGRNLARTSPAPKITRLGPTSASIADLAANEAWKMMTPIMANAIPTKKSFVYVLTPLGGSGMSLTARMMLSLLTRHEVNRMVRYVIKRPSVKAVKRLVGVNVKLSSTWARLTGKKLLIIFPKA